MTRWCTRPITCCAPCGATPPPRCWAGPCWKAVPELRGQGFTELMQQVARTGVPVSGQETPAQLMQPDGGPATHLLQLCVSAPLQDARGDLLGVLDIAIDVTEQVLARRQVQALNEELATTNAELAASNEEFLVNNTALGARAAPAPAAQPRAGGARGRAHSGRATSTGQGPSSGGGSWSACLSRCRRPSVS